MKLVQILDEAGVLHTEYTEPMRCDEEVLRKIVPHRIIFDESFMEGDFSFDDERFFYVCQKLDTGNQEYIDAGCFNMEEIR